MEVYKRALEHAGVFNLPKGYWHYASFTNGVKIPKSVRELFRSSVDQYEYFEDPFDADGKSFFAWLQRERADLLSGSVVAGMKPYSFLACTGKGWTLNGVGVGRRRGPSSVSNTVFMRLSVWASKQRHSWTSGGKGDARRYSAGDARFVRSTVLSGDRAGSRPDVLQRGCPAQIRG